MAIELYGRPEASKAHILARLVETGALAENSVVLFKLLDLSPFRRPCGVEARIRLDHSRPKWKTYKVGKLLLPIGEIAQGIFKGGD